MMEWTPMAIEKLRSFSIEENKILLNYIMNRGDELREYCFVMIDEEGWKIEEISWY